MLTQYDVVAAVTGYLRNQGWEVLQTRDTNYRGYSVLAQKGRNILAVNSQGATSSVANSPKHGKPFGPSEIPTHIQRAIYKAVMLFNDGYRPGIAIPKTDRHVRYIEKVRRVLRALNIVVFVVSSDGTVEELVS